MVHTLATRRRHRPCLGLHPEHLASQSLSWCLRGRRWCERDPASVGRR